MGPCETTEDCKYNAMMCITQMPDGMCLVMCNSDYSCNDDENNMVNKCVEVNFEGMNLQICMPGCENDSQCRSFGSGFSMKCHKLYNEKENICGMPCEEDADCADENAKCSDSRCVPAGEADEPDTEDDSDAATDGDNPDTASDDEPAEDSDDMNLDDDDQPAKKKKSSGCAITNL